MVVIVVTFLVIVMVEFCGELWLHMLCEGLFSVRVRYGRGRENRLKQSHGYVMAGCSPSFAKSLLSDPRDNFSYDISRAGSFLGQILAKKKSVPDLYLHEQALAALRSY